MTDEAIAAFFEAASGGAAGWPPPGTCTTWASREHQESAAEWLASWLGGKGLDAGPRLSVAGARSKRIVPAVEGAAGLYHRKLGGEGGAGREPPLLLDGELLVSGEGGRDAGPFRVAVTAAQPFAWKGPPAVIDRRRGLALEWRGGEPGAVSIVIVYSSLDAARERRHVSAPPPTGRGASQWRRDIFRTCRRRRGSMRGRR